MCGCPWCVAELTAAVDSGVPVVVVKKEGSGGATRTRGAYVRLSRTSSETPNARAAVFQIKIVEHSDVYYAPFIDKFFDRLEEAGLPPAEDPYALTTEELEAMQGGGRPRLRPMLSMMDGAAGRRPVAGCGSSLDRRSFDEDDAADEPRVRRRAPARSLDEVTSPRQRRR